MPATLDLYVNTTSPSKQKAFATSLRSLAAPAVAEYIVRTPTLRVRIHPMTVAAGSTIGTTLDWGDTPTIKFGGKLTSTFKTSEELLFYSEDFTKDATDADNIFYWADVTLNTDEFIAAFAGAATSISVITEIELDGDTVAQGLATGLWDVLRGGEGVPTPSIPAFPTAPTANTLLGGSSDGLSWIQRTVAQVLTLLGLTGVSTTAVTDYTGGGSLQNIATADGAMPLYSVRSIVLGDLEDGTLSIRQATLVTNTGGFVAATDIPAGYVLPLDYDIDDNNVVWVLF